MTRTPKSKAKRSATVSEAEWRATADALTEYLARREKPNEELRAKQARLLKTLAKKLLH